MKTIINHFINLIGLLIVGLIGVFLLDLSICTVVALLNGVSISNVMRSISSNMFFWTVWVVYAVTAVMSYLSRFNS